MGGGVEAASPAVMLKGAEIQMQIIAAKDHLTLYMCAFPCGDKPAAETWFPAKPPTDG